MSDRPRTGDDDESAGRPAVSTPPWLRTDPLPVRSEPGPSAIPVAEPDSPELESGCQNASVQGEAGPRRITLDVSFPRERQDARRRVEDDLSTLPLGASPSPRSGPRQDADGPSRSGGQNARAAAPPSRRLAVLVVAAGVVVLGAGVVGFVATRGALVASAETSTGCEAVEEPGRVVGSGPGSLDTPAGAVLAFDHAYYVERSAARALEAVSPSSRMSEDRVRTEGVEQVVEGTSHCVEVTEISPTLLDVTLTEFPPDADPVRMHQRIRVEQTDDGAWGIVSITPAG